jgi:hypothetical protein
MTANEDRRTATARRFERLTKSSHRLCRLYLTSNWYFLNVSGSPADGQRNDYAKRKSMVQRGQIPAHFPQERDVSGS